MLSLVLALTLGAPSGVVVMGPPPPVLLMVRSPGPAAFEKSQQRLHQELTLLLDSFLIILADMGVKDFARKSLAEEIAAVLPMSKQNDAVAVVWLAEPLPGQMMLHVVAGASGRTLVRTLEFDRRSQSENVLAVMLRELLGTAFIFEPPAAVPEAVQTVVTAVRETMPALPIKEAKATVAVEPTPTPESRAGLDLHLNAGALLESGLDRRSPFARFGFSVSASLITGPVHLGAMVNGLWLDALLVSDRLRLFSVPVLATCGWYPVHVGRFAGGFVAGAGAEFTFASLQFATPAETARLTLATFAAMGAFEGRTSFEPLAVWARLGAFVRAPRPQLVETSTGAERWSLAPVSLQVAVGVSWEGF